MRRLTCSVLLVSYFWILPIFAQEKGYFQSISMEDGLSSDDVLCLFEDHKGFIWIGTTNGLNRFDGYQMVVFKDRPSQEKSLRGNWVNCIFEDSKNRLWVGTDKGVNLLRPGGLGFEFVPLTQDQASSRIYEVVRIDEDRQGKIWLGTRLDGVLRLKEEENTGAWSVKQFLHEPGNDKSLLTNRIVDLILNPPNSPLEQSGPDDLLIFTVLGLHRIHTPTEKIERIPDKSKLEIWNSFEVEVSRMFRVSRHSGVGVDTLFKGSLSILGPNAVLEHKTDLVSDVEYGPGKYPQFIIDIGVTGGDQVWAAGFHGLHSLSLSTGIRKFFDYNPYQLGGLSASKVSCLLADKQDNLWIGTRSGGLNILVNNNAPFEHYFHVPNDPGSLTSNDIESLFMDEQGSLWVRSHDRDFEKLEFFPQKGWMKTQSLDWDVLQAFKTKNGNFFQASVDKGLLSFDPNHNQVTSFRGLLGDSVYPVYHFSTFCEDQYGDIWMGTAGRPGILKWDVDSRILKDLMNDPIWSKTIARKSISQIFEDKQKDLWFSTDRGLYVYDTEGKELKTFFHDPHDEQSITDSKIRSVTEDSKGNIWISTNYGLNLYNRESEQIHRFYTDDGLPNNIIGGVLEDDQGYIWVSTNLGLARSNITVGEDLTSHTGHIFRVFARQPGLMKDGYRAGSFWKDKNTGDLFFGGKRGFNIIHPERLHKDTLQPSIWISSLSIKGQDNKQDQSRVNYFIGGTEKIALDYWEDILTLNISDLNYKGYDYNQFEYQLLGLSAQWIPLGEEKTITFIDLKPGEYFLNVRGINADDIEIKERQLLEIQVVPPWWQSLWAYTIYFLALAFLIFLISQFILKRQWEKRESQRLMELDRFKSRLYTNITHEFRTPLTVILGMSEQLESDKESPSKVKEKVSYIRRNGGNLLNLVNQMLDLSKVENNKLKVNYIQNDIIPYLRYITESFHSLANSRNVLLRIIPQKLEIQMDYDPEKMRQILSNLLSNAIKYTTSGGKVEVLVDVNNRQNQPYLCIDVRDSGEGIPASELPYIFDRFHQADNAIAKVGGTGIGLALTKELTKLLKGNISVQSELGEGSTFQLELPISNEAPAELSEMPPILQDSGIAPGARVKENKLKSEKLPRLLIIEDNPDVIDYLISCLENHYQLDFAFNGEAGIEKALEDVPDIIISDVMMPEKDGFEVCNTLKNDLRSSHIPIVLLTAKADVESRISGLRRGADAYLTKPFYPLELTTVIQNLLDLREKMQARYGDLALSSNVNKREPSVTLASEENLENAFIQKLVHIIEQHLTDPQLSTDLICQQMGMSRSNLYLKLEALTDQSLNSFIRKLRLQKATELLLQTEENISQIAFEVGFSDPKYFSRVFTKTYQQSPTEYRKQ